MKLAISTNIPSHYQIHLGQEFTNNLKDDFVMICWESEHEERRALGWDSTYQKKWLINAWNSDDENTRAKEIIKTADVIVWGYGPKEEILGRIANNKLTFRYSERLFKRGRWRLLDPRVLHGILNVYQTSRAPVHHLLAVGQYCAEDFRLIRSHLARMWRWGYFPAVPTDISRQENDIPIVLWAGRMISWKRVDLLLRAAAWVINHGAKFRLKLIGTGPDQERLQILATQLGLTEWCEFQGPMSPEDVGRKMEKADIYVLPSNQQEGWGAVVNEAMSRGCCVIGSKSAGSVPWLIRDGVNGYVFEGDRPEDLGRIILHSIENPELRRRMGLAARMKLINQWSPSVAAERFLQLCEAIQTGKPSPFDDDGPCSPA